MRTVRLLEGDDKIGRRVTLLWREDRPDLMVCIGVGETHRAQTMIDNAVTRRILCSWYFAESPAADYHNVTVVSEYSLALRS